MKFTVADLLDLLPLEEGLPQMKLESALGIADEADRQHLRIGLDGLERLGLISSDDGMVRRREAAGLIPARLRCSSKGFCFALRDDGEDDIYIRDNQLNHAWNGDRVLVEVQREGGRRRSPEGAVCCILSRQTTSLLAQVEQRDDQLVAVPLDDRLLAAVALPADDAGHLDGAGEAVVEVVVDRFPVAQFPASGHVARSLPLRGPDASDVELLLAKHRLHQRPPAPRASLRTPVETDRTDLTGLPTLLLDIWGQADAPQLPALSLEDGETGTRLWIHAPSVAERVALGGSLDQWLREMGEALCLGGRWLPLLPQALAKACRFAVGDANDALSVALDLDADGNLQHYRFCRSRIRADARLDRTLMEALAARKPKARTLAAALKPIKDHIPLVERLQAVVEQLRGRRLAAGSIDLDLSVPPIDSLADLRWPMPDAGPNGWLVQLPASDPSGLLREPLLLAERALGRHLATLALPALFTVNPPPDQGDLNELARTATAVEIPLELSEEGHASAADLALAFAASDRRRALQRQFRDVLQPVQLATAPGPNLVVGEEEAVAPWTCPSLHYAAIWNQAVLVSLLSDGKDRPSVRHKVSVDLAGDACHGNVDWDLLTPGQLAPFQEALGRNLAQKLQERWRFSAELHADGLAMAQARQGEQLVGQTLPGVISGVQSYGFFVEVPPSQLEGLVHVSSLRDDWYEYRSRQNRLVGRKNRRTFKLGDAVEVEILNVDALRHQIDLAVNLPDAPEDGSPGDDPDDDDLDRGRSAAIDPDDDNDDAVDDEPDLDDVTGGEA
jgi:ribonuclease R